MSESRPAWRPPENQRILDAIVESGTAFVLAQVWQETRYDRYKATVPRGALLHQDFAVSDDEIERIVRDPDHPEHEAIHEWWPGTPEELRAVASRRTPQADG